MGKIMVWEVTKSDPEDCERGFLDMIVLVQHCLSKATGGKSSVMIWT